MSTSERLLKVLSEALNRQVSADEVDGKNLIDALGLNSIDALEVLIRAEGEFGIQIDDEDLSINMLSSIENLKNYVERQLLAE